GEDGLQCADAQLHLGELRTVLVLMLVCGHGLKTSLHCAVTPLSDRGFIRGGGERTLPMILVFSAPGAKSSMIPHRVPNPDIAPHIRYTLPRLSGARIRALCERREQR